MTGRRLALWLTLLIGLPVAGFIFVAYASEFWAWPQMIWGEQHPGNDLLTIFLMLADTALVGTLVGKWLTGGR